MITLDTNVISEMIRPIPDQNVLEWMARQSPRDLYITSVTDAELRYGVAIMYPGRRRRELESAVLRMIETVFDGRILPFDKDAAPIYAEIRASRRIMGRPVKELDCMIAAIARVRGAAVATRNQRDFEDCRVEVVNPWTD